MGAHKTDSSHLIQMVFSNLLAPNENILKRNPFFTALLNFLTKPLFLGLPTDYKYHGELIAVHCALPKNSFSFVTVSQPLRQYMSVQKRGSEFGNFGKVKLPWWIPFSFWVL